MFFLISPHYEKLQLGKMSNDSGNGPHACAVFAFRYGTTCFLQVEADVMVWLRSPHDLL
jgi:hypothetical protein